MKVRTWSRQSRSVGAVCAAVFVLALLAAPAALAQGQYQPQYGGTLDFAVPKDPPSFDGHRENTFALIHPVAPHYSLLLKFDQWNYPTIVGDVAESWKISNPSLLANLASPWNFIYKADILAKDPHWYEKNINGTGPFKFAEYVPGSHWIGKKNEDYFVKGRPYLDGYRAIFIKSSSARVAAVRGGRALIEFRGFPPSSRDDLVNALQDKIRVQSGPWLCYLSVAINNEKKPFNDVRVRKALSLALDRWEASETLSKIAIIKPVGGVMRPGSEFGATKAELTGLVGYGKDIKAARKEARRLLKEAGVPEGFKFTFKNRDLPMPYEPMGIWLIDQWRQIGLNVTHKIEEKGPYFSDRKKGNFQTIMDYSCDFMDEPDLQLYKYLSSGKSGANYSRYEDPVLDELYVKQSRAKSAKERRELIRQFERRLLNEKVYTFPTLWWFKINPHWDKVKGWNQLPSHYLNQDLRDVWLAK